MGTTTRVGTDGDRIASDRKGKGMPATGDKGDGRSLMSRWIVPHEGLRRALLWALAAATLLAAAYVEGTVPVMYR